jgi:hypothetical protein
MNLGLEHHWSGYHFPGFEINQLGFYCFAVKAALQNHHRNFHCCQQLIANEILIVCHFQVRHQIHSSSQQVLMMRHQTHLKDSLVSSFHVLPYRNSVS